MTSLTGKRVLITGAASGIGAATAVAFAARGARVAIHARRKEQLADTAARIDARGAPAALVQADLREGKAIASMAAEAADALGGIDILVNNAGMAARATVLEMEESLWDAVVDTNLKAAWLLSKAVLPVMRDGEGRLIFVSSISAKLAEAEASAYSAAKAGLLGFMRCLAMEVAPRRMTANAVCPGWVDTPMAQNAWKRFADEHGKPFEEVYDAGIRKNPLEARIQPEDVAAVTLMLASPEGRFITGQAINVCGGECYW
ncbi:MAG TPA: SDR family NAD(P)-dependent oxidoreductase [Steroidobacteraceae bacterium]|jgi:NAD(P)-dependent dehydrogenase (short-subunit alcohol dehydrogenase family)|nr:SDR family NAD(P)-dependent oxidoreductase [Steroidobacteraceae bacterium]